MTDKKFKTIAKAWENFIETSRGDIFFHPDTYSNLDGLDFEELSSWITQSLLISDVQVAFANFFPSCFLLASMMISL